MSVNPVRGEASIRVGGEVLKLRPSFSSLVAAEVELGSLFALVERAAEGELSLAEIATLFDHLSVEERPVGIDRARIGEAIVETGLVAITPQLRAILGEILKGR